MITYARSTYSQLIDDIREDINEEATLHRKSDESFQVDILRAQSQICKLIEVPDECDLRIATNVSDYNIQDRPAIVKVSNESPMVVLCDGSHELSTSDIINIGYVQGIDVNKSYAVTSVDAVQFSLSDFVRIKAIDISGNPVIITTEADHGFTTGNSIAIAATDVVDGTHTITVTETDEFTIPTSAVNTYTPGTGIASRATTGLNGYITGGRFWKENEIPTRIGQFYRGTREVGGVHRRINFVNNGELVNDKNWIYTDAGYSSYDSPHEAAQLQKLSRRYISVYPKPLDYGTVRLYGRLKIAAEHYYSDLLTSPILLDSTFDEIIKTYCISKAYLFLKDFKRAAAGMEAFFDSIRQHAQHLNEYSSTIVTYQ
jgi:hypothetical protein